MKEKTMTGNKKGRRIVNNNYILNLNEKKEGRWALSEEYLKYRREGGKYSPDRWNRIKKEYYYDKKKHEVAKEKKRERA